MPQFPALPWTDSGDVNMNRFDEFWKAYPRKVQKPLTRAKYAKVIGNGLVANVDGERLRLSFSEDDLIKAAKAFNREVSNEDREKVYIPHPVTWLNQGRFEDIEEDERDRLAAQYDRIQELVEQSKQKLRIVKG